MLFNDRRLARKAAKSEATARRQQNTAAIRAKTGRKKVTAQDRAAHVAQTRAEFKAHLDAQEREYRPATPEQLSHLKEQQEIRRSTELRDIREHFSR